LEWACECNCKSGKPNFDAIEFSTNNSRIEVVCGKCRGVILWWPISTEQIAPIVAQGTKKSLAIPTKPQVETTVDK
jgi:hypothetical protein